MFYYGIIGFPLGHSCSPDYFNERFRKEGRAAEYLRLETKDIRTLPEILKRYPGLRGFNVTIPHKENILPFLDDISEEAREIGAVNCVKIDIIEGKTRLTGYNTDTAGFRQALLRFIPPEGIRKALILGNGGAAKAVRYVLHSLNIASLTVSRRPQGNTQIGYPELPHRISEYPLIVNTTPLGTWPETENCPDIPYNLLTSGHYLFDLVYNPSVTEFMKRGNIAGAHTCNGYAMWLGQAEKNWEIWKNK